MITPAEVTGIAGIVEAELEERAGELLAEVPEAMIQRFYDLQAQEIAAREHETQVRQLEVKAGYRFSRASLEVQERHLREVRAEGRKKRRDHLYFSAFSLLLMTGLLVFLLKSGKEDLAGEILKGLVYITMGGTSGFFAGRSTERKKRDGDDH